jgi:hypothetical protein
MFGRCCSDSLSILKESNTPSLKFFFCRKEVFKIANKKYLSKLQLVARIPQNLMLYLHGAYLTNITLSASCKKLNPNY